MILYELFVVVNRRVALVAVFFSVVGVAVQAAALLGHFAPLILLKRGQDLGVSPELLFVMGVNEHRWLRPGNGRGDEGAADEPWREGRHRLVDPLRGHVHERGRQGPRPSAAAG
jgi:hypothetical protein